MSQYDTVSAWLLFMGICLTIVLPGIGLSLIAAVHVISAKLCRAFVSSILVEGDVALTHSERARRVKAHGRAQPSLQNLRGLEAFARNGSFAKAAVDQGLTLASISRRISTLERDLGVVLIKRSLGDGSLYVLTEEGSKLATFLTPWLAALDEVLSVGLSDQPGMLRKGCGPPGAE